MKKGVYGVVFQDVTRNNKLTPAAKGLYAYLASFCGDKDECFPSVDLILKEMGFSRETFYKHINALVAAGVVQKKQFNNNGRFGRTVYKITHEVEIIDLPHTNLSTSVDENSSLPFTNLPTTVEPTTSDSTTNNNSININNINNNRDIIDYQQIADMYNNTCVSFPRLTKLSENRKKAIKARLKIYSVEDFQKLFEMAEGSSFLKGQNNRNWSATFDWLIKDTNMAKVLDGNYTDRTPEQLTPEERQRRREEERRREEQEQREWEEAYHKRQEERAKLPYDPNMPFR